MIEASLIQHLLDSESVDYLLSEGFDPELIPTADLRQVYTYSIEYYLDSGKTRPVTVSAWETAEVSVGRTMLDVLTDCEIAPEDPEISISDVVAKLRANYINVNFTGFLKASAVEMAEAAGADRLTVLAKAATDLTSMVSRLTSRRFQVDARSAIEERWEAFEDRSRGEDVVGMRFGIPELDSHVNMIRPGELAMFGAYAKVGKSAVSVIVALAEWLSGRSVVLFTLENSIEMTLDRLACTAVGVDSAKFDKGKIDDGERQRIRAFVEKLKTSETPLYVLSPPGPQRTPEMIMREAQVRDVDSVILDQLSHVQHPNPRNKPRWEQVRDIMQDLKLHASTGAIPLPVLAMVQISRDGKKGADARGYHAIDDFAECFDDKTEVFTDQGWKLFSELDHTEKVATRTPNGSIEYQLPTRWISKPYQGEMFSYDSYNLKFVVTPNHKLIVKNAWERNGEFFLEEIRNLRNERYCLPRGANPMARKGRDEKFSLPPRQPSSISRFGPKYKIEQELPPVRLVDFANFVGLWIAEGRKNPDGYRVEITQSKPEGVRWIDSLMDRLRWPTTRTRSEKQVSWSVYSPELQDYLSALCVGGSRVGDEIALPRQSLDGTWGREACESLLHGLMMGDGSWNSREKRFDYYLSASKVLVDQVQQLLLLLGYSAHVGKNYSEGRPFVSTNGKAYVSRVPGYRVRVNSATRHAYYYPGRVKRIDYDGIVYCVTVPNHVIMVRRDGVPMWSGNSSEVERSADLAMTLYQSVDGRKANEALLQIVAGRRVDLKSWSTLWYPGLGTMRIRGEV